jgi:hypothetical protein
VQETEMPKSTKPLTPLMLAAIQGAEMGSGGHLFISTLTASSTVRGLRDRDLIDSACALTDAGKQIWAKANPAPETTAAVEAWVADDDADTEQERATLADPLEAPLPQTPAQRAAAEGDRNAEVRAENEGCTCSPHAVFGHETGCRYLPQCPQMEPGHPEDSVELDLPQRTPGKALTQELTGEEHPLVSAGRPGHRAQVLLRPLNGEVVERASRETFLAVGSAWGALEGRRVRVACMDGDVFHQRPLMIVEAGERELDWKRPGDQTVHVPSVLYAGATALVDSCRVYQVDHSPLAGETPKLWPVK